MSEEPDDLELSRSLARSVAGILEHAHSVLNGGAGSSATSRKLSAHLGVELDQAVMVSVDVPFWQHVSTQRGIDAYLLERQQDGDWIGITSQHREHMDLMSLLLHERGGGSETIAAPEYTSAASGPSTQVDVISFGLLSTSSPSGDPVVVALHSHTRNGPPALSLHVLAADRRVASTTAERLRTLTEEHDVIRGQVVSFGASEHYGNAFVTFLPRPEMTTADVILAPSVLPTIEHHILSTGEHAERLRRTGIHLKRGLLLHGPPGTGKTHTVRYLMSRMSGSTVVVLSGSSLRFIEQAAALARRLAPTVVVVEDVDLVGRDRSFSPDGNPLLFTLLDAMDGVAADADVTFVLTTNRAADLEEALIERPGRIDLAVEIPRPDAAARDKLLRLYAGRAELAADLEPAVAATAGATASAMKELMRRSVLAAIEAAPSTDATPVVTDAILLAEVDRFVSDAEALSRALIGAGSAPDGSGDDGAGDESGDDGAGEERPGDLAARPGQVSGRVVPGRLVSRMPRRCVDPR